MKRSLLALVVITITGIVPMAAKDISAQWRLESNQAVVGQALGLQLEIRGTDQFTPPRLEIPGIAIEFAGGGPRNSSSIVSINGQTTRTEVKAWIGTWTLKAITGGTYTLPGLQINAGGQAINLSTLVWNVREASTSPLFFLRQSVEPKATVVGLDLDYKLVWYIGQSAQNPEFTFPILDTQGLSLVQDINKDTQDETFDVQYKGQTLRGIKGSATENNQAYTTLSFNFRLRTEQPGRYTIAGTMVLFEGATETRRTQDFFGNIIQQPIYERLAARASDLTFDVQDVPTQGRPSPFSGLIGSITLRWEQTRNQGTIGEPLRARLLVDGVLNKPNLDLATMVSQALADPDWVVGPDPSENDVPGTQAFIFRFRKPGTMVVPPLGLNYYDPINKTFKITQSPSMTFTITGEAQTIDAPNQSSPGLATTKAQGAAMYPNRIAIPHENSIPPWWAILLPGFIGGGSLAILGLWKHSARRLLREEWKMWKKDLGPLTQSSQRAILELGRQRLKQLSNPGSLWKDRMERQGWLKELQVWEKEWDAAFFDSAHDFDDWASRWQDIVRHMEAWK